MSVSKKTVLFLKRNGFVYADPDNNTQVSQTFTGAEIRDMEVLNEDLLTREIGAFIAANTLEPAIVTVVLWKDILFEQRYVKEELEKRKDINLADLEKKFSEITPFDNVSVKTINFGKDVIMVSTNSAIYLSIIRVLESHGFIISSVLPILLPELEQVKEPSAESAKFVLGKAEALKSDNFLASVGTQNLTSAQTHGSNKTAEKNGPENKKTTKGKRVVVLIGVFGFLFLVLAFMVFKMILQK